MEKNIQEIREKGDKFQQKKLETRDNMLETALTNEETSKQPGEGMLKIWLTDPRLLKLAGFA